MGKYSSKIVQFDIERTCR